MLINQLHEIVLDSLSKELYSNAVFYAERLLSETDVEEVKYLLAKGYTGEGKFHKAFNILKDTKSSQCRYLFAQTCLKLNRLVEAERALLTDKHYSKSILSKDVESIIPNGPAGYYLLGIIAEKLNRSADAIGAFKKSLDLDPFMWCSYEKLCKLCPNKIDTTKLFSELNLKILTFNKKHHANRGNNIHQSNVINSSHQPKDFSLSPDNFNYYNKFNSIENKCVNANIAGVNPNNKQVNRFNLINSNCNDENEGGIRNKGIEVSYQGIINSNNSRGNINQFSHTSINANSNMTPVLNKDRNDQEYHNQNYNHPLIKNKEHMKPFTYSNSPHNIALEFNKSSDIQNNQSSSVEIKNVYGDSNIRPFNVYQSGVIPNTNEFTPNNLRNILHASNKTNTEDSIVYNNGSNNNMLLNNIHLNEFNHNSNNMISNNHSNYANNNLVNTNMVNSVFVNPIQNVTKKFEAPGSFNDISHLLKYYGEVFKLVGIYNSEDAIAMIKTFPQNHQKSGLMLSTIGRCYFEMGKYKECDKVFKECLKLDPARLEGFDYYSSCLWHLKDQYQLCNLANHALEQSHFAYETWIVLGNCYSLQKEHEIAIKFFNRATQLNPSYAYAYTLCGHEYVENESFNQAKQCYSQAIACDDRHFNAWWGLGHICLKEQNFTDAIKFFRKALTINERSAILNFYLASAYQNNKELSKAEIFLNNAEKLDGNNAMIKYQKANILINKKKLDEALKILFELNDKMPKEAPIHILIGKIFKTKRDFAKALAHFNTAIDIDPKDSNLAKSLIEKLYSDIDGDNGVNFY